MKVFDPKIEIRLIKTARRGSLGSGIEAAQRYREMSAIDLTPYLQENSVVSVQQFLGGGSGTWSCMLVDKMLPEYRESLYALIEPMDMVEIRMAHAPHEYQGQSGNNQYKLPIVMRGFVSTIARSRTMEGSGIPSRYIQLAGQDYLKLLEILRIYYLNNSVIGDNIMAELKFFQKYAGGDQAKIMDANEFVRLILDVLINPFIAKLTMDADGNKVGAAAVHQLLPEVSIEGSVSPYGIANFPEGSVLSFLHQFLDIGAFNEMFIDDREDGAVLVVRPNQFIDLNNKLIQQGKDYSQDAPEPTQPIDAEELEQARAVRDAKYQEWQAKLADAGSERQIAAMHEANRAEALEAGDIDAANAQSDEMHTHLQLAREADEEAAKLQEAWQDEQANVADLEAQNEQAFADELAAALKKSITVLQIPDEDVESINEGRSDAGVANYYWVTSAGWMLFDNMTQQILAEAGNVEDYAPFDYVNTSTARYGLRKMELETRLGPPDLSNPDAPKEAEVKTETDKRKEWLVNRRRILAEQNRDNAVLEYGSMHLRGNERIKRGMYLLVSFGDFPSLYYVTSVQHQFIPFGGYKTIVGFERGTAFAQRAAGDDGTYLKELNLKGAL